LSGATRHVVASLRDEPWALLANQERVGFSEPGVAVMGLGVNLDVLMAVTSKVVDLYARAIRLHVRLMGYDEAALDGARVFLPRL